MNLGARVESRLCTSVRLFVAIAIAISMAGCKQELYSNLTENEAAQMWALLLDTGIEAEKFAGRNDRFGLRVTESQVAEAVRVLGDCGLPHAKFEDIGQLFSKSGLVSSPKEEQARFLYGVAQGLSKTLSQIDGVITARVHVVVPENNPFAEGVKPSSASVFIKQHPGMNLEDIKTSIKLVVAKSIEGLSYDEVTVAIVSASKNNACGRSRSVDSGPVEFQSASTSGVMLFATGSALGLGLVVGSGTRRRRAWLSKALARFGRRQSPRDTDSPGSDVRKTRSD